MGEIFFYKTTLYPNCALRDNILYNILYKASSFLVILLLSCSHQTTSKKQKETPDAFVLMAFHNALTRHQIQLFCLLINNEASWLYSPSEMWYDTTELVTRALRQSASVVQPQVADLLPAVAEKHVVWHYVC